MANKSKQSKKASQSVRSTDSNVVRIRASSQPARNTKQTSDVERVVSSTVSENKKKNSTRISKVANISFNKKIFIPFRATGSYFKGSWQELRQVRWPNRRATWSLTLAVLVYGAFFGILVLLLDAGFKYLFELVLGK